MGDTPIDVFSPGASTNRKAVVALSQRPSISLRIQQGMARKQELEKVIQPIATYPAEIRDEELPASRE